jgi:uncharacterized protein YqiB (DUF1249 family)
MKKPIMLIMCIALLVSAAWANPVSEISRPKAKADLKAELEQRYESNYSIIEKLLKNGMENYDELCKIPDTKVNNNILKNLMNRHYPNFSIIMKLYESNKKAYERLNK